MNHPSIQASRPQPPPGRADITGDKQHMLTPDCAVLPLCYFQQRLQPLPEYLSSLPLWAWHGETCSQISQGSHPRHWGILRLTHTEDPLGLRPNPCLAQCCPTRRAVSDQQGRVSRLQDSDAMFEIWELFRRQGSPGWILHTRQIHPRILDTHVQRGLQDDSLA